MISKNYSLKIDGITPLVMNSNAALLTGGVDKGRDKAAYEREHFRELSYHSDGKLFIPARAIKKAMILAARFITDKPKGVSFKSFGPIIEGALLVDEDAFLTASITDLQAWTSVVNLDPSKGPKGPRGARTRPLLKTPWSGATTLTIMDDLLTLDVMGRIAEAAGKRCGLLDARSIDYGRCHMKVSE